MIARLVLAAGLAIFAGAAQAENLTISISTREVKIDSNFTGATITIFGVIGRDAGSVSRAGGYKVASLVLGPPESAVARRKDRILGVWANGASETFVGAPAFYALDTSAPLAEVAEPSLLGRYSIGLANIAFAYRAGGLTAGAGNEFRDAYLRLKQEGRLYAERISGVSFIGDNVFRADVAIPANVPVGTYTIAVYLFSGSSLLATAGDTMEISKSGFEQFMSQVAHNQSLAYGLACVALALFTGWLAGVIFRRD